jgi:hypothetical protein
VIDRPRTAPVSLLNTPSALPGLALSAAEPLDRTRVRTPVVGSRSVRKFETHRSCRLAGSPNVTLFEPPAARNRDLLRPRLAHRQLAAVQRIRLFGHYGDVSRNRFFIRSLPHRLPLDEQPHSVSGLKLPSTRGDSAAASRNRLFGVSLHSSHPLWPLAPLSRLTLRLSSRGRWEPNEPSNGPTSGSLGAHAHQAYTSVYSSIRATRRI